MRSPIRCGVCSTCLTLLVSPDFAGGGLGRARVVSRRRVPFSFFCFFVQLSRASIRTYRYIPISGHVYNKLSGVAGMSLSLRRGNPGFDSRMAASFFVPFSLLFCSNVKKCTMMTEVSSEQSRGRFYMHSECFCRCRCRYCCSVAMLLLLLQQPVASCCCSSSCAEWPNLLLVH